MKQGGNIATATNISSVQSGAILVTSFEWKHQEAACKHLGLQLQRPTQHIYQPYEYNFQSVDLPEVVQDCGADGDCFYRWVSKNMYTLFLHCTIQFLPLF